MAQPNKKNQLKFGSIDDVKIFLESARDADVDVDQKDFMEAVNRLGLTDDEMNSLIDWCQENDIDLSEDRDVDDFGSDDDSDDSDLDDDEENDELAELERTFAAGASNKTSDPVKAYLKEI